MKLSKIAVLAIRGSRDCKVRLSKEMQVNLNSIFRWLSENADNGDLTKALAVKIIEQETGLQDHQILESEPVESSK